jgi:plastocyanin
MSQDVKDPSTAGGPPRADDSEHTSPRLPPIAYALLAVAFGGAIVWAFSRILLALSKDVAPVIAIFVSMNILVGAALVAYGRRVRRRPASFPLLVIAGLIVIAAGIAATNVSPPTEGEGGGAPQAETVRLQAKNLQFDTRSLSVTAGAPITLEFTNADAGVQHDVAIFDGVDATAPVVFRGSLETGVATVAYQVPPLAPGTYFFHCDVHPTMTGTVTAAGGGGPQAGGPGPGGVPLSAKNLAFSNTKLTASPAGGKIVVDFSNEDTQPHNVAVFNGSSATAPALFHGDIVPPGGRVTFTFDAPPPGTYFFHCDVHPQMTGTLTVSG